MLIPVGESPPFIEFSALASSAVLYAPMLVLMVKRRGEGTADEIFNKGKIGGARVCTSERSFCKFPCLVFRLTRWWKIEMDAHFECYPVFYFSFSEIANLANLHLPLRHGNLSVGAAFNIRPHINNTNYKKPGVSTLNWR